MPLRLPRSRTPWRQSQLRQRMRKAPQWMRPFSRVRSQLFCSRANKLVRPPEDEPGMIAPFIRARLRKSLLLTTFCWARTF